MSSLPPPELFETTRLHLRRMRVSDAPAIFEEYAGDPAATKYLMWRPHTSVEETIAYRKASIADWDAGRDYAWGICVNPADRVAGAISLRVSGHKADLGYVLSRRLWGQGIMPEAGKAVVQWALSTPTIWRVWAVCDVDNAASAHVLEKIGMKREGILHRWAVHPNVSEEPRDCFAYSICR